MSSLETTEQGQNLTDIFCFQIYSPSRFPELDKRWTRRLTKPFGAARRCYRCARRGSKIASFPLLSPAMALMAPSAPLGPLGPVGVGVGASVWRDPSQVQAASPHHHHDDPSGHHGGGPGGGPGGLSANGGPIITSQVIFITAPSLVLLPSFFFHFHFLIASFFFVGLLSPVPSAPSGNWYFADGELHLI